MKRQLLKLDESSSVFHGASYILHPWLQWTYCISVAMVIGAAVWFYLLTPSSKAQAYAPTILSGIGMSAAFVMALAFLTDLIGDNKVCNIALYLTFWLTFWLPLVVLTLLNFSQMVTFLIPVSGNFELLCVTQCYARYASSGMNIERRKRPVYSCIS